MKRRAERQQDFEAIKSNLFAAGVSTVKAAKAQEEMFTTTLEALAEAYEGLGVNQLGSGTDDSQASLSNLVENLLAQRQAALVDQDYSAYIEAEEKLQRLDELAVQRLERQVRLLVAQQQLVEFSAQKKDEVHSQTWTESTLKKKYKTLDEVRQTFSIGARTWKDAVKQVNEQVG